MLNFFRRLRQNLLRQNKFNQYLLYALGEIVLVVFGILIALAINNMNIENGRHQKSINYHERIIENLDQLIILNEGRLEKAQNIFNGLMRTIEILEEGNPDSSDWKVLEFTFLNYGRYHYREQDLFVLEEMKSNGDLDLIYNKQLGNEIATFNSLLSGYEDVLKMSGKTLMENQFYYDQFFRISINPETKERSVKYNFEEISTSKAFINRFSRILSMWEVQVMFTNQYIEELTELKEKFRTELKRIID